MSDFLENLKTFGMISPLYQKNCECRSTSTTMQTKIKHEHDKDSVKTIVTLYPGLCCDNCGEPWIVVRPKN